MNAARVPLGEISRGVRQEMAALLRRLASAMERGDDDSWHLLMAHLDDAIDVLDCPGPPRLRLVAIPASLPADHPRPASPHQGSPLTASSDEPAPPFDGVDHDD